MKIHPDFAENIPDNYFLIIYNTLNDAELQDKAILTFHRVLPEDTFDLIKLTGNSDLTFDFVKTSPKKEKMIDKETNPVSFRISIENYFFHFEFYLYSDILDAETTFHIHCTPDINYSQVDLPDTKFNQCFGNWVWKTKEQIEKDKLNNAILSKKRVLTPLKENGQISFRAEPFSEAEADAFDAVINYLLKDIYINTHTIIAEILENYKEQVRFQPVNKDYFVKCLIGELIYMAADSTNSVQCKIILDKIIPLFDHELLTDLISQITQCFETDDEDEDDSNHS